MFQIPCGHEHVNRALSRATEGCRAETSVERRLPVEWLARLLIQVLVCVSS